MSSDIRLGIIGAGANTMAKHIPLLQAIDGVEIIGVSMHPVNSNHDIMYLLDLGNNSRHVASHALNSASSRSHCIFTLYIEQSKVSASGQATRLKSKFNLIDLAGSERAERTGPRVIF